MFNEFHIRINEELAKKIKELASNENRSINKQIEYILMKYFKEKEEE